MTVVSGQGPQTLQREDDHLLAKARPWDWKTVGWSPWRHGERRRYWSTNISHKLLRKLPSNTWRFPGILERAERPGFSDLAALAASVQADLFIGHYPAGLAAAARAVRKSNALLAYDAEDLHTGEHKEMPAGCKMTALIDNLERRYIRQCAYVSASSPGIAEALSTRYGIAPPLVIQNTFPWTDRRLIDGHAIDRKGENLSIYWFSQTIGPGRGIEDAIRACGILKTGVDFHLRGTISSEFASHINATASNLGIADRIHLHGQVSYDKILSRTAEHDVGLALENPITQNRNLCQTNKLFIYLLAGIAIAATDTVGQRLVLDATRDVGALFSPGDHHALAAFLKSLRDDPAILLAHKNAALRTAREQWNWEQSSGTLIQAVKGVLKNLPPACGKVLT